MSWGIGGAITAALLLIALEVTVTSSNVTGIASLAQWPGRLAASWIDPATPLIPAAATAAPAASTAAPAVPANITGGLASTVLNATK